LKQSKDQLALSYYKEHIEGVPLTQDEVVGAFLVGFNSAEKEFKKQLRDLKNKYKSWLQQETQSKFGKRSPNFKRETELLAKIELLEEIEKKL